MESITHKSTNRHVSFIVHDVFVLVTCSRGMTENTTQKMKKYKHDQNSYWKKTLEGRNEINSHGSHEHGVEIPRAKTTKLSAASRYTPLLLFHL